MSYLDLDTEPSWEDFIEKVCMFFQKHHWAFFFLGCLVGLLLKPAIIGLIFLVWLICLGM